MATVSKSNVWAQVEAILTSNKVKASVIEELKEILAPKAGGGISLNPSKEIDGVMHHFCRFHQNYYAESDMVMSQGKSKGYCKAAISKWNKINAQIKKTESSAVGAICKGDFELAKKLSDEANELKAKLNDPKSYDAEADWKAFNLKD